MREDIRKLETMQRAATKLPETMRELTYEERLERLGLETLEKRRERSGLMALQDIGGTGEVGHRGLSGM